MRYIYIVRCSDNSLYTGITNNLEKRIADHNSSPLGAKYTRARRPVTLVRSKKLSSRSEASKAELQIKKLTKKQKEEMVKNNQSM